MAVKPKVTHFNEARARGAYLVHVALITAEIQDPSLRDLPEWTILRQDAFERFHNAFEGQTQ